MKPVRLIFLAIIFYFLSGCENVDVVETKIEYKEKIVVSSEITAGSIFPGVTFTRTLPIGEPYDINKALILNALSYLRINYVKIVPLHYHSAGLYLPSDSLEVQPGDVYELFGNVEGKSVYAETIIPKRAAISNAVIETDYIQTSVTPLEGEVYGAKWLIYAPGSGDTVDAADQFFSITEPPESNPSGPMAVRTSVIPDLYLSSAYLDRTYMEIYSFDKAYLKYYNSRGNQQVINNTFIQGGASVVWNVFGDDVIGLFIGVAKSKIKAN
ncbi:MAG: hypothetical protein ACM34J_10890 [Ignavibacteria bacterium]